ncbi:hypothetical protein [Brumimicrobium mesophilum]|uniref:hypothetical protein n=1 Tax=Brumimicrobium mesophilum TaxID=392717 RepID=UPI00131C6747|nr:hypothetical protein [Brumimicrobium mesophilum]
MSLVSPDSAVAYAHTYNRLEITGINQEKTHTLLCSGDTISKNSTNSFGYSPKTQGVQTLQLFEGKKIIKEFQIRVETLNPIQVYLAGLRDSVVSSLELFNNPYFEVTYTPQLLNPCTSVQSCYIIIEKANGDSLHYSNIYSLRNLEKRINLENGDVFIVHTVTLKCPSCKSSRKYLGLRFTIKND